MPRKALSLFQELKRKRKRCEQKETDNDGSESEASSHMKQKSNFQYTRDCLIKATSGIQTSIDHNVFAAFNAFQQPLEDVSDLQDFPNWTISLPCPIYVAPKHNDSIDLCHRRTTERSFHMRRIMNSRTSYHTALKKHRTLRTLMKQHIYHNSLFDLAERIELNPDDYFSCSYDFYYTGGTICAIPEEDCVVHAGGNNLRDLCISRISVDEDVKSMRLQNREVQTYGKFSEIFEIAPFSNVGSRDGMCFTSRQRSSIAIHLREDDGRLRALKQFNNNTTPMISFAQSKFEPSVFLLSTMNEIVRVYDINGTSELLRLYQVEGDGDTRSWNTLKAWNEHTFLYANNRKLLLMDLRTSPDEWRRNACNFRSDDFLCENIVSLATNANEQRLYVGASHVLYCLDLRSWSRTFSGANAICRWRHQLEYPPLLVDTMCRDGSELIALSSPVAGDLCICELTYERRNGEEDDTNSKYIYKSSCLPYQPVTLGEAYDNAKRQGKCLRPDADFKRRLRSCTSGLTFYKDSNGQLNRTLLLSANSCGDVFASEVQPRVSQAHESRTSTYTDDVMHNYQEQICRLTQPPLNFTHIVDMKGMGQVFRCEKLNKMPDDDLPLDVIKAEDTKTTIDVNPQKEMSFGPWRKSISSLLEYKDVLAHKILNVWDINAADHNQSTLQLNDTTHINQTDRINKWMDASQPPMISIPRENINTESLNESMQMWDETSTAQFDSSVAASMLDSTSKPRNQSRKRKRQSYVKGF